MRRLCDHDANLEPRRLSAPEPSTDVVDDWFYCRECQDEAHFDDWAGIDAEGNGVCIHCAAPNEDEVGYSIVLYEDANGDCTPIGEANVAQIMAE